MKKITLWLFALFTCWQINAQTCNQTFSVTGQDNGPTVLTINAADVTCYGANPLISLKLENSAGSLTSGFCSSDGLVGLVLICLLMEDQYLLDVLLISMI